VQCCGLQKGQEPSGDENEKANGKEAAGKKKKKKKA
jgi:hypothetical protein